MKTIQLNKSQVSQFSEGIKAGEDSKIYLPKLEIFSESWGHRSQNIGSIPEPVGELPDKTKSRVIPNNPKLKIKARALRGLKTYPEFPNDSFEGGLISVNPDFTGVMRVRDFIIKALQGYRQDLAQVNQTPCTFFCSMEFFRTQILKNKVSSEELERIISTIKRSPEVKQFSKDPNQSIERDEDFSITTRAPDIIAPKGWTAQSHLFQYGLFIIEVTQGSSTYKLLYVAFTTGGGASVANYSNYKQNIANARNDMKQIAQGFGEDLYIEGNSVNVNTFPQIKGPVDSVTLKYYGDLNTEIDLTQPKPQPKGEPILEFSDGSETILCTVLYFNDKASAERGSKDCHFSAYPEGGDKYRCLIGGAWGNSNLINKEAENLEVRFVHSNNLDAHISEYSGNTAIINFSVPSSKKHNVTFYNMYKNIRGVTLCVMVKNNVSASIKGGWGNLTTTAGIEGAGTVELSLG